MLVVTLMKMMILMLNKVMFGVADVIGEDFDAHL
jgi:hypothetical protein